MLLLGTMSVTRSLQSIFKSMRGLSKKKWYLLSGGDIIRYEKAQDDGGKDRLLVTIQVRREVAKTRKRRLITVRGREYFKRLHERTKYKEKRDYIFFGDVGTKRLLRKKLYAAWADLMKGIGLNYQERH